MGLSLSGDEISIQPLPVQMSRAYLQSLDLEVGFLKKNAEIAEQFSTDEMAKNFLKAFTGLIFAPGEIVVFDFHGQNLKGVIKGLSVVELPNGGTVEHMGILMDKTDINIMKAGDSLIKLKSSSKKYVLSSGRFYSQTCRNAGHLQTQSLHRTLSSKTWVLVV